MRSLWKGKTLLLSRSNRNFIRIYERERMITKDYLGKRVYVYNGKRLASFLIRPLMLGLPFGQFSLTKKMGAAIHQTAKNKKKGKIK